MWPFLRIVGGTQGESRGIDVSAPRHSARGNRNRVSAEVDGRPLWFESSDTMLQPAPEAFGTALLVPALHAGRVLHLHAPVCATWHGHLPPMTDIFRELWYPHAPAAHAVPSVRHGLPASGTALCFSAGVDSFHTLLCSGRAIDTLAFVVGYDVKLRETRRAAAVEQLVRQVAAETSAKAVVIRTNLRRHPLLKGVHWLRTFGGAMAAVGHLLSHSAGRLLISSSGLAADDPEAGSRLETDELHSSARLTIEHFAHATTRLDKIRALATHPLVQRNLRVCWKNVGDMLNCGRCEKCLRTMLALDVCGVLGDFASFDFGRGMVEAIDALPPVDSIVAPFYHDLLARGLSERPAAAVTRLLARSQTASEQPSSAKPRHRPTLRSRMERRLLQPDAFASVFEPLVGKRVGYVRPIGNVGDELIEIAMVQLLSEYGIRWSLCDLEQPDDFDMLVFAGGGNMGTLYMNNYELRTRAIELGLPLTILPQSFTTAEDRPFHRIYIRERASRRFCPTGMLAPDLALGLAWPSAARPVHDVGVFMRRDGERLGPKPLFNSDPARLCRTPAEYLALAADHRRIITDRLHFAIAGLHAGRSVTLVANSYHKNRSMYDTWLAQLGCQFVDSPREALPAARRAA